ncbi:hypothetical protein H7J86_18545 [Mycobacterium hackensackense]|uniref:hypothetical protein n=1 Tax=Mycobacterium hackensackense TaxID=228909 RepID=UPI002265B851|nr:hypothetical protein [Mycobacterium hackensackense]MCV7254164.1 hypothetical protein [Mycobacterium hackensackense]
MADWAAAAGSVFAAFTALYIATTDRRERHRERAATSAEQATLVISKVRQPEGPDGYFTVEVFNYGAQAVLDLAFDSALFDDHPKAVAEVDEARRMTTVLDCNRQPYRFFVVFIDADKRPVLAGNERDGDGRVIHTPVDLTAVHVWVRFRDADGITWRRSSTGGIERIGLRHR